MANGHEWEKKVSSTNEHSRDQDLLQHKTKSDQKDQVNASHIMI